ncbi:hypothetical protein HWV62_24480 [Athelia sp. TMB]|nr:hypothetical protein HWV62_24480 [Athelia sp. TMB]
MGRGERGLMRGRGRRKRECAGADVGMGRGERGRVRGRCECECARADVGAGDMSSPVSTAARTSPRATFGPSAARPVSIAACTGSSPTAALDSPRTSLTLPNTPLTPTGF